MKTAEGGVERLPFEPDDYDQYDDEECANCGGEGFYYSCDEEFACIDPEGGCDLCRYRCDWCNPKNPTLPASATKTGASDEPVSDPANTPAQDRGDDG